MNKFFIDAVAYETKETALIGGDIKKIANCSLGYFLYVDDETTEIGQRPVGDGEGIRLDGNTQHFFVVPPCTM